jgi:hypothetical protein
MMVASLSHRRPVVGNVSSQVSATSPHIASPRPFPCPPWREMARASQRTAELLRMYAYVTHLRAPLGVCEGGGPGPRTGCGARKFVNSIAYHTDSNTCRQFHRTAIVRVAEGDRHISPAMRGSAYSFPRRRRPYTCTPRSQRMRMTSRQRGIEGTTDLRAARAAPAPPAPHAGAYPPTTFGRRQAGRPR